MFRASSSTCSRPRRRPQKLPAARWARRGRPLRLGSFIRLRGHPTQIRCPSRAVCRVFVCGRIFTEGQDRQIDDRHRRCPAPLQPTRLRRQVASVRSVTSLAEAASPKEGGGCETHRASHRLRAGRHGLEELKNPTFSRLRGGPTGLSSSRTWCPAPTMPKARTGFGLTARPPTPKGQDF